MSDPRAFVSFDFDHNESDRNLFIGQSKHEKVPVSIQDWSAKEEMAQHEWEEIVEGKIKRCNMVIVLVGRFMASAKGVGKEIDMAKRNNVPIFGVYVDGATAESNLPNGLQRNRTIKWTWAGVDAAVRQMMGEGKNSGS